MATRFVFRPGDAEFPASNFPQYQLINRRPVLSFDPTTNESAMFSSVVPQGWTGTITAYVHYFMASATTDTVDLDAEVEAISDGDALDMDAADGFDSVNSQDNTTVPGTAGYKDVVIITLTNEDGAVAGDEIRFRLTRDAVSDDAGGDMHVTKVEIRDGA